MQGQWNRRIRTLWPFRLWKRHGQTCTGTAWDHSWVSKEAWSVSMKTNVGHLGYMACHAWLCVMAQKETLVYHLLSIFNDYNHINYNNIVFISLKEQLFPRTRSWEGHYRKRARVYARMYIHWCYGDSKGHWVKCHRFYTVYIGWLMGHHMNAHACFNMRTRLV